MAVSIKVGLQQTQKLAMTQSLRQSIEMLQLSTLELAETISRELVENPVLEEEGSSALPEADFGEPDLMSRISRRLSGDDSLSFRREEKDLAFTDSSDSGYSGGFEDEDRKRAYLENAVTQEETLKEHLLSQARLVAGCEDELRLLESIITAIDDRGMLSVAVDEIAGECGFSPEDVRAGIRTVGALDPAGCGASSVQESLALQAAYLFPEDTLLQRMLSDYFRELERLEYERIAKGLGVTVQMVVEKSKLLQKLTPFPGRQFSMKGVRYIIPDVEVKLMDGEIIVGVNDDWIPRFRVNHYYLDLLKKKNIDKNLKDYIKDKLQSARALMKNISGRRDTITKVVTAIMHRQREFLEKGPGHLRPLTHTMIAQEVGLHESTVSRVTSNKFVQTGWGVFELKYFFVSRLKSAEGDQSSDMIQSLIKDIISRESSERPLNDEEILLELKKRGIHCARRTIAKYRRNLGIPSSGIRRRLNMINNEVST